MELNLPEYSKLDDVLIKPYQPKEASSVAPEMRQVTKAGPFLRKFLGESLGLGGAERRSISMWEKILSRAEKELGGVFIERKELSYPMKFAPLVERLRALGYVTEIGSGLSFNDEPRRFHYVVKYSLDGKTDGTIHDEQYGSSSAGTAESAFRKSLGEAIERQVFCAYRNRELRVGLEKDIKGAVKLDQFRYFTDEQLKRPHFAVFRKDPEKSLAWFGARDLILGRAVMVPAQCVFWNYRFFKDERGIMMPVTNGQAVWSTLDGAYVASILEMIERDAFLIHWLRKLVPSRVDINLLLRDDNAPQELKALLKSFRRYEIDVNVLDLTSDLGIPVYAAVLRDPSGISSAASVGAHADFDPYTAISSALHEALRILSSDRLKRELGKPRALPENAERAFEADIDRDGRLLLWSRKETGPHMEWFLKGDLTPVRKDRMDLERASDTRKLAYFLDRFKQKNYSVYGVDRTPPELRALGLCAAKIIIPQMMPLYLHERWPYLGCERLYSVPKTLGYDIDPNVWNEFPHPFP